MLNKLIKETGLIAVIICLSLVGYSTPTFASAPAKKPASVGPAAAPKKEGDSKTDAFSDSDLREIVATILRRDVAKAYTLSKLCLHGEDIGKIWGSIKSWNILKEGQERTQAVSAFAETSITTAIVKSILKRDSLVVFTSDAFKAYASLAESAIKEGKISLTNNPNAGGASITVIWDTSKAIGVKYTKTVKEDALKVTTIPITKVWLAFSVEDVISALKGKKNWDKTKDGRIGSICPSD